jgi:hypothetical protein
MSTELFLENRVLKNSEFDADLKSVEKLQKVKVKVSLKNSGNIWLYYFFCWIFSSILPIRNQRQTLIPTAHENYL